MSDDDGYPTWSLPPPPATALRDLRHLSLCFTAINGRGGCTAQGSPCGHPWGCTAAWVLAAKLTPMSAFGNVESCVDSSLPRTCRWTASSRRWMDGLTRGSGVRTPRRLGPLTHGPTRSRLLCARSRRFQLSPDNENRPVGKLDEAVGDTANEQAAQPAHAAGADDDDLDVFLPRDIHEDLRFFTV